jgi:hypothetical protein
MNEDPKAKLAMVATNLEISLEKWALLKRSSFLSRPFLERPPHK